MAEILYIQIFITLVFKLALVFLPLMFLWIPTAAILSIISPARAL